MTIDWQQYTTADGILNQITSYLSGKNGKREARNIGLSLLQDMFNIGRGDVLMQKPLHWNPEEYHKLEDALHRLSYQEPLQHITQKAHFWGLEFTVNRHVLIPRPETEELVQWIIDEYNSKGLKVLDIGTGSGCIAIALALNLYHPEVTAIDVDPKAIEVAEINAEKLKAKVNFVTKNILTLDQLEDSYDIIVSNPPYIPLSEKSVMQKNVLAYEPGKALFVDEEDGLLFYHKIADLAVHGLKAGGKLFFEINENKGAAVKNLLMEKGFSEVTIRKDMQGKDRMAFGQLIKQK